MTQPLLVALWVLTLGAALAAVFVVGMRHKSSPVVSAMRRVNRAVFNPIQLKSAGTPGAYAALLRHTGRTSGRAYETPVGAVPCPQGFAVGLVYGPGTDWLRNVQAAGSAELVHGGTVHQVRDVEVLPIEAASSIFPPSDQRAQRMFGVKEFALLRTEGP
jgi:deazaflavin-dependent oxidoreductase (nitroreductase family)